MNFLIFIIAGFLSFQNPDQKWLTNFEKAKIEAQNIINLFCSIFPALIGAVRV